ncbi:glycosyltransferase [Staphylococcus kloosii]|uniref:glycosyltransferase n=1 Tax=Staphylococcus kloosii TaxID=29384 RepID=UPI001F547736|nr:glycosyltransferase family 2 protein [Staphylococcus kloosii]
MVTAIIICILIILLLCAMLSGFLMFRYRRRIKFEHNPADFYEATVIIPARDEVNNLPQLLTSLNKYEGLEIIVMDDQSTDNTKDIAKSYGVKVYDVPQNKGWSGKSYACWEGAKRAQHSLLLFLDADVRLAQRYSIEYIFHQYKHQNYRGLLTIQPYHRISKLYENFSAIFNLMTVIGLNVFSYNATVDDEKGAFGPILCTNKADYVKTKGHYNARHSIIEGFAISKAYNNMHLPVELFEGVGVADFRMYPNGLSELIGGWSKHIAAGSSITKKSVIRLILTWLSGSFLSLIILILAMTFNIGQILFCVALYTIYSLQFTFFMRRIGNFNVLVLFLFHPILFLFFIVIFTKSWIDINLLKTVKWKGRKIKTK